MSKRPSRRDLLSGAALSLIATSAAGTSGVAAGSSTSAATQGLAPSRAADAAGLAFDQGWPGRFVRSVADRLKDIVSILDFIPVTEHAAIRARTSTTDLAGYFQAAIDYSASLGYGTIFIPSGRYRCGSPVTLTNNLTITGAGKASSHIQFTHAGTDVPSGSGFRLLNPSNRSTGAYVTLEKLWFENINSGNRGACFYDRCSTFVTLRDCIFAGGRYGVIFDQTEVSGIYTCEMSGQLAGGAGLWLVNGPDITPGNLGVFTNQITVDHNCQFNQSGTARCILDDGGEAHHFGNNNYNGGAGLRFAGCTNLTIIGGEYESISGGPIITLASTSLAGGGVGSVSGVIMNGIYASSGANPAIGIISAGTLVLLNNFFSGGSAAACITGTANASGIYDFGNRNASLPLFDNYATVHVSLDGSRPIRTETDTSFALSATHYNSFTRTTNGRAITVTVPANATLPIPIGMSIYIEQGGVGAITLSAARGVTLNGTTTTAAQYQVLKLTKTAADRWIVTRSA